jgi:glucose/arabinose dehydrogenase
MLKQYWIDGRRAGSRVLRLAAAALLLAASLVPGTWPTPPAAAGSGLPPGFVDEAVVTGLTQPTAMAWSPDGRLFIALKPGLVHVFHDGQLLPQPFIDITAEVKSARDRGLLGLAVHPDFPVQPYVYLLYTYDPPGLAGTTLYDQPDGVGPRVSRLLRVRADPANLNRALDPNEPDSRVVLLGTNSTLANIGAPAQFAGANNPHPPASCLAGGLPIRDCLPSDSNTHSIGMVLFSPDGSLLAGSGDGSDFNSVDPRALRVQDLDSLAGKIVRIDPLTGQAYPDNPFFDGDAGSNRSKVIAYGLRNPFRFTVSPDGSRLFIGDVGWISSEELNTGIGQNFGWPCYEGSVQQAAYLASPLTGRACQHLYDRGPAAVALPLFDYALSPGNHASVVMGAFYTGSAYPPQYQGALFFSDYIRRWLKYITFDGQGAATVHTFADNLVAKAGVVQIAAGPDGNLYYLHFDRQTQNASSVRRLRYTAAGNQAPVAHAAAAPTFGPLPLRVEFSALGSHDPDEALFDSGALDYQWNFGDGTSPVNGVSVVHTYTTQAKFTAVLTVTDSISLTTASVDIHAGRVPPLVTITAPLSGSVYTLGANLAFSGSAASAEHGPLSGDSLAWSARLHHALQTVTLPGTSGASGSLLIDDDYGDGTWLALCLTATDPDGLSAAACRKLLPHKAAYTFQTDPPGLLLIYNGSPYRAPFTIHSVVDSQRVIAAPDAAPQVFTGWADSGPYSRTLLIQSAPLTLTAAYTVPHRALLPLLTR